MTGKTVRGVQNLGVDLEQVIRALGIDNVTKMNQFNLRECREVLKKKLVEEDGPLAVIATGPCALKYKKKPFFYYVDPDLCIGCRSCVNVGCPPISMRAYPDKPKGKLNSHIDRQRCVGCSVCYQVCPVKAIKPGKPGKAPDVATPLGLEEDDDS
ncbi:MAG: hypothetical protein DRI90_20750 [Deltaproteobacteria bacterium]|nr:MAG: hypothetical protein DRI90_20750 [Deltaproteobacteria bacterium]